MVWAALVIILMQGVLAIIGLRVVRSFGAFVSTFLAAHTENVIVQQTNAVLTEQIKRADHHIRRATEVLSDRSFGIPPAPPSEQEKSA